MTRIRAVVWLFALALATIACSGSAAPPPSVARSVPSPSAARRSPSPTSAPTPASTPTPTPTRTLTPTPTAVATATPMAAYVVITAKAYEFTPANVTGPADQPLTIAFENLDGAFTTHNLHLTNPDGSDVLVGEFFHGPATKTYTVDALTAGTYPFVCDVHSDMKGTLTIE